MECTSVQLGNYIYLLLGEINLLNIGGAIDFPVDKNAIYWTNIEIFLENAQNILNAIKSCVEG